MDYFNVATFESWKPFMGGSNIPTLNALLEPYHIALGQSINSGTFRLDEKVVDIVSGSEIIRFPKDGYLISPQLKVQMESTWTHNSSQNSGLLKL